MGQPLGLQIAHLWSQVEGTLRFQMVGEGQLWFFGDFHSQGEPALACTEVEFVTSVINAVYPVAERADKIKVRIQLARVDPRFSLVTREFLQRSLTFVAAYIAVGHLVIGDRGLYNPSELIRLRGETRMCIRIHAITN